MFRRSMLYLGLLVCVGIQASLPPKEAEIFSFLMDASRNESKAIKNGENEQSFKPKTPRKIFSDLVGDVPYEIEDIVSEVKNKVDKKEQIRTYKIILHGPPGGGKTTLAEAIAGELGWDFYSVSAGDLLTEYQGSANKKINELLRAYLISQFC